MTELIYAIITIIISAITSILVAKNTNKTKLDTVESQIDAKFTIASQEYYRKQAEKELLESYKYFAGALGDLKAWTNRASTKEGEFKKHRNNVIAFGSSLTTKKMAIFSQLQYNNNNSETQKLYVALVLLILALKEDCTGVKIEPEDIFKVNITDYR